MQQKFVKLSVGDLSGNLFFGDFLGLDDSCVLEIYIDIYRYIIIYYIYLFSIHIISANLKLVTISTKTEFGTSFECFF